MSASLIGLIACAVWYFWNREYLDQPWSSVPLRVIVSGVIVLIAAVLLPIAEHLEVQGDSDSDDDVHL